MFLELLGFGGNAVTFSFEALVMEEASGGEDEGIEGDEGDEEGGDEGEEVGELLGAGEVEMFRTARMVVMGIVMFERCVWSVREEIGP